MWDVAGAPGATARSTVGPRLAVASRGLPSDASGLGLTSRTRQLRRSETPDSVILTRRMSSGLKEGFKPPVKYRCQERDPRSSVAAF
jgi:hypothetical protein